MITLTNVWKEYRLFNSPGKRVLGLLPGVGERFGRTFTALKDVTLTMGSGETVGLIGPNGAGKSTLLKLVAGTSFPTRGNVEVEGRVAALLELGTGFHPEFTGRQNLYIGGRMLGLSEEDIRESEGEIIDFSELHRFIDQPFRTYSSGMMMRLGFALAACVDPKVLIIDEALSVGDAYFSQKCIQRIKEFQAKGTTILFVSHDPSLIVSLCSRAHLMHEGQVAASGAPGDVMEQYNTLIARHAAKRHQIHVLESVSGEPGAELKAVGNNGNNGASSSSTLQSAESNPVLNRSGSEVGEDAQNEGTVDREEHVQKSETDAESPRDRSGPRRPRRTGSFQGFIEEAAWLDVNGEETRHLITGMPAVLRLRLVFLAAVNDPTVGILIRNRIGLDIFGTNTSLMRRPLGNFEAGDELELTWKMKLALGPGDYTLNAAVHHDRTHIDSCIDWADNLLSFSVVPNSDFEHIGPVRLEPELTDSRQRRQRGMEHIVADLFPQAPPRLVVANTDSQVGFLSGWHWPEVGDGGEYFRWSEAEAILVLRVANPVLQIDAAAFGRKFDEAPVTMILHEVGKRKLGSATWESGMRSTQRIQLPNELLGKIGLFSLKIDAPLRAGGRDLGLALFSASTEA